MATRYSIFHLSAILVFLIFSASELHAEKDGKIRILLLGDSTTEGSIPRRLEPEGPHLEQMIEHLLAAESNLPQCEVYNSGVSGEYIQRLLENGRYEKEVAGLDGIDYIFIRYGINDRAKRENFSENFPKDFHVLLDRLKADHPDAILIPVTVIPFSSEEASREMNDIIREVAKERKLEVFDLYPLYEAELVKGRNMLNYRRYPIEKIPKVHHKWLAPYVHGDRVEVMSNELDALFGDLPGWFGDRHPNLAGYNVIAVETAKYLAPLIRKRTVEK